MRKTMAYLLAFFVIPGLVQADVYVKGKMVIEGGYRYGHNVPQTLVINEWWFGENKVTFQSTGWRLEFMHTDWRITLDKNKQTITAINLSEKIFVEVPHPMGLLSHIDPQLSDRLKAFHIEGKVEMTGEKETIDQRECVVYTVSERIFQNDDDFYERQRTLLVSEDVPVDWNLLEELHLWMRSFFNPQPAYLSELDKIKGFVIESKELFLDVGGSQIAWTFELVEISQKESPPDINDFPESFLKKGRLSLDDLADMGGMIYPRPLY